MFRNTKRTYIFSGRKPWTNKKTEVNNRNFETAVRAVDPDAMKL